MSTPTTTSAGAALGVHDLYAGYGAVTVLHGVDLTVPAGTIAALLGPNGAGKTTLLRVISGLLRPSRGTVTLDERDVTSWRPARRSRAGACLVPEGRGVFPGLSVRENLSLFAPPRSGNAVERALDVFPALRRHVGRRAGTLSGGQQQMVALARAWIADPRLVLLDEVSMGLAPIIVDEIFEALSGVRSLGTTVLIVEQYVDRVLAMADAVHLLDHGRITFSGAPSDLDRDAVLRSYLGIAPTA